MSQGVISALSELCKKFGVTVDWTQSNLLPYIQQLTDKCVAFEFISSLVWVAIVVVVIKVLAFFADKSYDKAVQIEFDESSSATQTMKTFVVLLLLAVIIGFVIICFQVFDVISCLVFPEKVVIDYIQSIM